MEEYITGTGQKITNVHDRKDCEGSFCPIHNPSDHIMREWPTNWRDDRRIMERICKCGVGHPDPDDLNVKKHEYNQIHGCCGCCSRKVK